MQDTKDSGYLLHDSETKPRFEVSFFDLIGHMITDNVGTASIGGIIVSALCRTIRLSPIVKVDCKTISFFIVAKLQCQHLDW